ncbi:MAG: hypothetical protein DRJ31_00575 [Candidatus Methanomethylicota archaeon]|uniref:Uncharacterized protein n=1 Tax=Thermoproteota archaeon TaxID=2056631 RepID=A0A497ETK4_9CREN|nr:MAG: hypothetical protein DRJ31_00575 [Candidatus Verstraetearchaeota archaeon]
MVKAIGYIRGFTSHIEGGFCPLEFKLHHPLMKIYSFYVPVKLIFGVGASKKLSDEIKAFKGKKVLVVTGRNVERLGLVQEVISPLEKEGYSIHVYSNVVPEPTIEIAREVAEIARQGFEIVLGIGGGSAMDMAKVASAAITNPEPVEKFIGAQQVKNRGAPLIQIPTLSGTGSEVSPVSVLIRDGVKEAIWSYNIFPYVSLIDPALATTAPPNATASSGIDALCHAIESIMSTESNQVTEALCLEAIRLISTYLERAYANGDDIEARYGIALASMLAALSFTNTMLCLGHGIAYTFSVDYNVPHGVSCGIAEPYVMEYNMPAVLDKLVSMADAFGVDIFGLSMRDAAYEAIAAFRSLADSLEIPSCLKDLGVEKEKLESMVDSLFTKQSRFIARNPRKPSREEMLSLYERMWEGME